MAYALVPSIVPHVVAHLVPMVLEKFMDIKTGKIEMPPSQEAVSAFQQILMNHHYTAILRASKGSDILAACGQLSGQANSHPY